MSFTGPRSPIVRKAGLARPPKRDRKKGLKSEGKRKRLWNAEKRRQNKVCRQLEINACELRFECCKFTYDTGLAHSKKRRFCVKEGLDEVIKACWECHKVIEALPHAEMERIVKEVRAHRGEEYFVCGCLKLITPADLRIERGPMRRVCDDCYERKEAA